MFALSRPPLPWIRFAFVVFFFLGLALVFVDCSPWIHLNLVVLKDIWELRSSFVEANRQIKRASIHSTLLCSTHLTGCRGITLDLALG